MKLQNIFLCDYCGQTGTLGIFKKILMLTKKSSKDLNVKNACENFQLDFRIKSVLNKKGLGNIFKGRDKGQDVYCPGNS